MRYVNYFIMLLFYSQIEFLGSVDTVPGVKQVVDNRGYHLVDRIVRVCIRQGNTIISTVKRLIIGDDLSAKIKTF